MSYRIDYGRKKQGPGWGGKFLLCALFFLLGMVLQQYFLTRSAPVLEGMVSSIREGAPVGQAVEAFCQEIFHGIS